MKQKKRLSALIILGALIVGLVLLWSVLDTRRDVLLPSEKPIKLDYEL